MAKTELQNVWIALRATGLSYRKIAERIGVSQQTQVKWAKKLKDKIQLVKEKELEFLAAPFGIASLECALALYIKALIEPGILDWSGLISLMTHRPAGVIGIDKGTIAEGDRADITIIDPDAEYTIDAAKFESKSRNCPYSNWQVTGRVQKTIVAGEIRYSAD